MDRLEDAVTQLVAEVEQRPSRPFQTANQRANLVLKQTEDLRLLKARWNGLKPQTEALLVLASPRKGQKLSMDDNLNHGVPRRYTMVGDQMRGLFSMLQDLNTKLEGELDAQEKFSTVVERLVHMVAGAEKRLAKVTGVWISSAPSILVGPGGAHAASMPSIGKDLSRIFLLT